jgi:hypothetical protein
VRGTVERLRDRGHDGEAVHGARRPADGEQRGGGTQSRSPDEPDPREHPLAADRVGQRRGERRQQRRGDHPHGRHDADRRRAAVAERDDAQRDHHRPLARPHHAEGELGAAQRGAMRDLRQGAGPGLHAEREPTRHRATIAGMAEASNPPAGAGPG